MESYLAYFDETGDDGLINTSTDHFVLTSIYMPADRWQSNFNKLRDMRIDLKNSTDFMLPWNFTQNNFSLTKILPKLGMDTRRKTGYSEALHSSSGIIGYAVH